MCSESTCLTSLGLAAGKLPAACLPTWYHALTCLLLAPPHPRHGPGMGPTPAAAVCMAAGCTQVLSEGFHRVSSMACDGRRWLKLAAVRVYVLGSCMERAGPGRSYGCSPQCISQLWTGVSEVRLMMKTWDGATWTGNYSGHCIREETLEKLWQLPMSAHKDKGVCASPVLS